MLFEQITIVGVGLIGGSIGLAVKAHGLAARVVGVGRDLRSLARAKEMGAIDAFTTDLAEGVKSANFVIVCTPVDRIADVVVQGSQYCPHGTIFTDAGSTKREMTRAIEGRLRAGVHFVGSHPLAGSEKTGVEHARSDLFRGRHTVLTKSQTTDEKAYQAVMDFWRALLCTVSTMTPEDHDVALAITSHLPHAIASGVAGTTPVGLLALTAGGFRDVTRIAAGDPELWTAIFAANRDSVLAAAKAFSNHFDEFQRLLAAGDGPGLVRWLAKGKQVRDALGS